MECWQNLLVGFQIIFQPMTLLFCFLGCLLGTLVGVLPGLGPIAALSILLPITYVLPPVPAIILLAAIYYGTMYGGSTTSILLNLPGEVASVVTCLDGYQMARQGRAGPALGIAAFASFIAGTITVIGLMIIAPLLADFALKFGPPEYFALIVCGLTLVTFLSKGPMWKALVTATIGVYLSLIGTDSLLGATRLTMGILEFTDGLGLGPVAMGLFGISEVLLNIEQSTKRDVFETNVKNLLPNKQDWAKSIGAIIRGSFIGLFLGLLPGGGAILSSFTSYAVEKKVTKHPENFGAGAIEGVAGPEAANNAGATSTFIPMLSLGIPPNATMAILFAALMISGMQPGPLFIRDHPQMFWGLIASMYIGNLMLIILNLPLIGIWVKILKVPYPILFPLILVFCVIGAFSINNSIVDVITMLVFGIIGYFLKKFEYPGAPLLLGMVLGLRLESALRRSLIMERGDMTIFFRKPIAAILLVIAAVLLLLPMFSARKQKERNK